jgi:hypothetical protein
LNLGLFAFGTGKIGQRRSLCACGVW